MATKKTTGKKLADMMYGGDQMRATPQSRITGPVANAVRKAQQFASQYEIDPRIPLLGGTGIDELFSLPEAASLMEDVSYNGMGALIRGGNAATGGIGTFRPDPRIASAADVALTTTGLGSLGVKGAKKGALAAGRAGARMADRVVPQIMERGGAGADILRDMAQGSRSGIVPVDLARKLSTTRSLPQSETFQRAVANTPGASITDDGLLMPLQRGQKIEQEMAPSVRGGVFYLPKGAAQGKHYSKDSGAYGGSEKVTGETSIANPLFVKGATGGKSPEQAYIELMGKDAFKALQDELMGVMSYGNKNVRADVSSFLSKHAPELEDYADYIVDNSKQGNQLRYALQEAAIGSAARNAGHDAIVGYSKKKTGEPFISEVFDVREVNYPSQNIEPEVFEKFTQPSQPVHFSDNPDVMQLELAKGGLVRKGIKAIRGAAESAGQKAPVLAEKDLTTLQDAHTNLGDRVRAGAMDAQKMMEGFGYQYDKGQRVFTKDSAGKNKPPYTILNRTRVGNQVMREDHPEFGPGMGRPIIDPETGKAMRTPYEPGYRVRMERGPDDWSEFEIPEKAIVGDVEMAKGGIVKKLARLARAPAKSKQEIDAIAERLAPQVTGEYVRKNAKTAKTVADKTQKQFQREKTLPVDVRPTGEERIPQPVDIEKLKGEVMIGIPGDPTLAGKTLYSVGDVKLGSPSPQQGGPLYGLYNDDAFWASGEDAAKKVQNLTRSVSELYDAPVLGNYIMMGPDSLSYAQHFADANLQAIDLSKMTKRQIEEFNKIVREGYKYKKGEERFQRVFPSFPGIEDKDSAYLHMAMDSDLRKHFNDVMQKPTVTERLNLPSGQDIRFAITEPALRDMESGVTGYSMGRMRPDVPSEALRLSQHPTYSHDIPGQFMGTSRYPMPYELTFPDTVKSIREDPKQAPYEFGTLQYGSTHQTIDQQMIDEIRAYEERMKALTGKKAGGAVRKAAGGEITADDLILEERKL